MADTSRKKILVIEDERRISQVVEVNLMMNGYDCEVASDGELGLKKALTGNFDLILLDLMLPKMDGFTVCREVRKSLGTPIIMVTAKDDEIDKITGLDIGADDYVTKPFSMKVLLARIKANIRRTSGEFVEFNAPSHTESHNIESQNQTKITIRDLVIDTKSYTVTRNGCEIELSNKEYEVLYFLSKNLGQVFSREEIMSKVWGYDGFMGDARTVDVTMSRLRSKVESDPSNPEYILTKRSKGYYIPE